MTYRLLALPVLAALAVAAPSHADPVHQGRAAFAHFSLPAGAGHATVLVDVEAFDEAGAGRLTVTTQSCVPAGCAASQVFAGALPAGALALDPSAASGRLQLTLGGLPLDVRWRPQGSVTGGDLAEAGSATLTGDDTQLSLYRGSSAQAVLATPRGHCTEHTTVGDRVAVETAGQPSAGTRPLAALRLPDAGAPACPA